MVIRRSHLYFGLLLVPWAILYGVTAYLFNHPSHFSTSKQESVSANAIPANWPTREWNAKDLAQRVVDQLNARFEAAHSAVKLDDKRIPKFEATNTVSAYEHDGRSYSVSIAMDGQRGTLRSQPVRVEPPTPKAAFFEVAPPGATNRQRGRGGPQGGAASPRERSTEPIQRQSPGSASEEANLGRTPIFVFENFTEHLKASVVEIAGRQGHEIKPDAVRISSIPDLAFNVSTNEEKWECRYSALTGSVNTKPSDTPNATEFSWRRFLLRLHTAHAYPDEFNARWFWAIVVDLMAFVMVFWGVSGIVMWWQIKATRPTGSIAMVVSLLVAVSLGIAMYRAF